MRKAKSGHFRFPPLPSPNCVLPHTPSCKSFQREQREVEKLINFSFHFFQRKVSDIFENFLLNKTSSQSFKLRQFETTTYPPTDSLTGVKCRATSVAKNFEMGLHFKIYSCPLSLCWKLILQKKKPNLPSTTYALQQRTTVSTVHCTMHTAVCTVHWVVWPFCNAVCSGQWSVHSAQRTLHTAQYDIYTVCS